MKHNRKIVKAIKSIKGLTNYDSKYMIMASTKDFHIRVIDWDNKASPLPDGEKRWVIQFAYRKTFDRWANSTNFETQIWYDPKRNKTYPDKTRRPQYTIPDLNMELAWCKKVAESGMFHWNTYFYTIKTPLFIYPKQQQPYDFIEELKKEN